MQTHDFFTRMIALNCVGPNMLTVDKSETCIIVYECSGCGEEHDDESDAKNCCRPQEIFKCSVCRQRHDYEDEAASCCPGAGANGQPMQCPVCLKGAEDFETAVDCCLAMHPTMTAFGRQRVAEAVSTGTPWPEAVAANISH